MSTALALPVRVLERCRDCGYALVRGVCPICLRTDPQPIRRVPSVLPLPRLDARMTLR